jgi:chromosomal replication initiation ATPase DnaA
VDHVEWDEEEIVMVQLPPQNLSNPSETEITTAESLRQHYRDVRHRLRHPAKVVPDTGFDLKSHTTHHLFDQVFKYHYPAPDFPPITIPTEAPVELPVVRMPEPPSELTFSSTVAIAAEDFGLDQETLHRKTRKAPISRARQVAMYLAFKQKRWSVSWIARRFKVDHTTGLYAIKRIQELMGQDDAFRQRVEALEAKVALLHSSAISSNHESHLGPEPEGDVSQSGLHEVDTGS